MRLITIVFLVSLLWGGCGYKPKNTDRKAMMESAIVERVERFRKGRIKNCHNKVMKEANTLVDSILVATSKEIRMTDSLPQRVKPVKPYRPTMPVLADTASIIKPLLVDSTILDL